MKRVSEGNNWRGEMYPRTQPTVGVALQRGEEAWGTQQSAPQYFGGHQGREEKTRATR